MVVMEHRAQQEATGIMEHRAQQEPKEPKESKAFRERRALLVQAQELQPLSKLGSTKAKST